MNDFYRELTWRGFIHSETAGVEQHLRSGIRTGYIGFDPTASSLHVGSLLPLMGLMHFQRGGHMPIAIAGGGTGMIGDPSGKSEERKLLSKEDIEANVVGIKQQLSHFLDFSAPSNPARLVNNADWLGTLTMMGFLRDIGKYFSVNEMIAKDSVKSRIAQEQGMSFTEFSYSLLQSYDFLELSDRYGCTLQMGGSDQWGNIVSGTDLIRRLRAREAYGVVFPLITTSSGVKFGKTESGTVWLDPARTSPYRFYQFWYNTDDRDVVRYLKFFTLLGEQEIGDLDASVKAEPHLRKAQTALAGYVTELVHGKDALGRALQAKNALFGKDLTDLGAADIVEIFENVPSVDIPKTRFGGEGIPCTELLVDAHIVPSKGEARRSIEGGGIYLNNVRVNDPARSVSMNDVLHGKFVVIRKGAKSYTLVRLQ
ncbi:MAG TPA: tyrosine--tRNA ligase [Bacteroidota bacterium]|nr:tyrosine--tRNA ligase [Bacteroidota bacterium]